MTNEAELSPDSPTVPASPDLDQALTGTPDPLLPALKRRGFEKLTAVQEAVANADDGRRDLRISSQTGSGKTVAIGFALANRVLEQDRVGPTTLLARPNATMPPAADVLTTMRLSFAGKQLKAGEHKLSMSDMTIAVSAKAVPDQKIGRGFVEQIDIKAKGLHLRITSSKANKFADEQHQVLGLHLDVEFLTFDEVAVRGALPEMWGLQPMTEKTKLLQDKKNIDN